MRKALILAILAGGVAASSAFADVQTRKVTFQNEGETLVGVLFLPETPASGDRWPAVVVAGAWTSIKEQMSGEYARQMAERGFVALAFDYRGWGESAGSIRFKEDPATKSSDIGAAIGFLSSVAEVDRDRISGLGICASAGYMADAVSANGNIRSVALVAPWLHNAEIVEKIYGGAEGVASLIALSKEAEQAEKAGEPRVIVAASTTEQTSLMYRVPYYTETDRGLVPEYDNKFNLASWEPWLTYNSVAVAGHLDKPLLIVHSQAAAVPQGARAFSSQLKIEVSELWLENVSQFDFYDRPDAVTRAADAAAAHFERINGGS